MLLAQPASPASADTATPASALPVQAAAAQVSAPSQDERLQQVIIEAGRQGVTRYVGASSNTAARLPADPMDLPVAGASILRAVIEDQGVIRAAEAVRNVSGVTRNPAYMGFTDSYRVRGFNADIGLWNGFRRDFYYSFTDTVHLERIEVIKGAASVTYGDLEPGGVVNYVTRRPSRRPSSSAAFSVGSHGLVRPELDLGWASADEGRLRARVTAAAEKARSHREHVRTEHQTLGLAVDWDLSPATRLELSAYGLNSDATPDRGFFTMHGPLMLQMPPGRYFGEPDDRYRFKQGDASAQLTHRFNDTWSLRTGVNLYRVEDLRDNIQQRRLLDDGRTLIRGYTHVPGSNRYTTAFVEARVNVETGAAAHTLVAGFEHIDRFNEYDFRSDRSSDYALDILQPVYGRVVRVLGPHDRYQTDSTSQGLYLQDLIALGERWRLLAGLRHSRYAQRDQAFDQGSDTRLAQSETTPRLGVLFRASPEWSVFASVGRSFQPQQYSYGNLRPGSSPTPERGDQVELGWKFTALDERLVAGMTAFHIRKKNVATTDPTDADRQVLTGEQTSRGLEFDASVRVGTRTRLIASWAWVDAVVSKDEELPVGDRLVNVPRQQASLWVRHDLAAVEGLGLGLGAFAVGRRQAQLPNTWTIPGYVRVDAALSWQPRGQPYELALHLRNLTDRRYHDSQGNILYAGAPRNAMATLRWRF